MHTTHERSGPRPRWARAKVRRLASTVAAATATALAAAALVAGPGGSAAQAAIAIPTPFSDGATPVIMPGVYTIQTTVPVTGAPMSLDVSGAGTANGTPIQVWENNGGVAQKFYIQRTSDGYYTLQNPSSGKYVDVINAGTANNTLLQLWPGNNSCAQKWGVTLNAGSYSFFSACSGRALDLINYRTVNGNRVQIYTYDGNSAQRWRVIPDSTAMNLIMRQNLESYPNPNNVLDVVNASTADGAGLQTYPLNETTAGNIAQGFDFMRTTDGFYKIRNQASGKFVDVYNAGTASGTKVWMWPGNDTCAQKWAVSYSLVPFGQGQAYGYTFFSACSGKTLQSQGGTGNPVMIGNNVNTSSQVWVLATPYGNDVVLNPVTER